MISGWTMVDSFRLPETVAGSDRIGKDPKAPTDELVLTPSGSITTTQTQETSCVEGAPLEDVTLADTCPGGLPTETDTAGD